MTKQEFRDYVKDRMIFLDGATGSNLMLRGMPGGVCPEKWIMENTQVLIGLQKEYVAAGTNILYAPTFTANRCKLKEYGLEDRLQQINTALVAASKEAAGGKALVAGDLTMTGEQLSPVGSMDFEELVGIYKEQICCLEAAGVDLLVVETMMSLQESRAALLAAKEAVPGLPVMVTMTFEGDGRSLYGTDAVTAAVVLESQGAAAVGANCSTGPDQMAGIIRQMAAVTHIPVIAKPNAGLPSLNEEGKTVYEMQPREFAEEMQAIYEAGAAIVGGCCGTTPEHIACLYNKFGKIPPAQVGRRPSGIRYLTSERKTVAFGLDDPFLIIGERINPTGKKKLQAELREGSFEMVTRFAEEQEAGGASILDVNMGMSGIDEKEMMLSALEEVGGVSQLPLSLDSSHVEVMEAALRRFPGRALINSVSLEKEKFEKLIPMAKKYGAMFILLPLSDAGLPETLQEKKDIIETILERAYSCGLAKEDIIVDGLVATVGANPKAALETLETIRYCKEKQLATVCGLSNISFGLPERSYVNSVFLTMAIQAGLTMAIANPSQELLVASAFASDMLLCKPESALRYIEYAGTCTGSKPAAAVPRTAEGAEHSRQTPDSAGQAAGKPAAKEDTPSSAVYEAVLKGNRNGIEQLTRRALEAGAAARELLDTYLLPAINQVGELFDKGKYFLPQLIASAEAMKLSISVLEPLLSADGKQEQMPVVVIATVEGDIHDIGKNLVALMLRNYGFQVIDLGKDVPKEKIIEAAKENGASIIGLSALMTTTMQEMRHVVELAHEEGLDAKIIIGGAVVTREYAEEIHADGYASDAADTVRLAKRLLGLDREAEGDSHGKE
nr:homocysteine S-methyltransferase family protein [uncultured Eisenbergiella sp.]